MEHRRPTSVFITVDTECREERRVDGRIQPAAGYDLRVWGRFSNAARALGIELIMDELEQAGLRATFYVDPFGARSFGLDGLREVCRALTDRGHDVQLHAHPRQAQARWASRAIEPPADMMHAYDRAAQARLLREGLDILEQAGVERSRIVSFRAGHYAANNRTWEAMADVGLALSSSFNPSYLDRSCRIDWPKTEVELFDTRHGVWELPISTFAQDRGGLRHLQISAVSPREMISCLEQAHALAIREVTIVTHSFEFCHIDSVEERRGRPSRINLRRLRALCRFLATHRTRFAVETAAELARRLPLDRVCCAFRQPRGSRLARWQRTLEHAYRLAESRVGGA